MKKVGGGYVKNAKKNIVVPALIFCLSILPACFPHTRADLRAENPEPYRFTSELSYQAEYRAMLEFFNNCYVSASIWRTNTAEGNLYTDIQSGEINIVMTNSYGRNVMADIEIRAAGDSQR